jgi:hypothetical protein
MARVRMFETHAAAWAKSQQLLSFLSAMNALTSNDQPDAERDQWVQWAAAYSVSLDPLRKPVSRIWQVGPTS